MPKIFFNSSLPRSGSTLIQNILAQNPNFYCTPTSGLLELLALSRNYRTAGDEFRAQDPATMEKAFLGYCKGAMEGYFSNITDKRFIIDKCRGWGAEYRFAMKVLGERPKVICMIRDPRAIVASFEKKFRTNPDQTDFNLVPAELRNTTLDKRVNHWLSSAPVGLSLERLYDMIQTGTAKEVLFVKFDDLCLRPEQELVRIYDYLEIPEELRGEHDFDNVQQLTIENDIIHGFYGDHKIHSRVAPVKPDFKEVLGSQLSTSIKTNMPWFYNYFKL